MAPPWLITVTNNLIFGLVNNKLHWTLQHDHNANPLSVIHLDLHSLNLSCLSQALILAIQKNGKPLTKPTFTEKILKARYAISNSFIRWSVKPETSQPCSIGINLKIFLKSEIYSSYLNIDICDLSRSQFNLFDNFLNSALTVVVSAYQDERLPAWFDTSNALRTARLKAKCQTLSIPLRGKHQHKHLLSNW